MAAAVTLKLAVDPPAAMFTEVGTVRIPVALLAIVTVTPPVTAALFKVMVQLVEALESSDGAAHCSADRVLSVANEMAADLVTPFNAALTFAVWSVAKALAVALNVALAPLAPTVTDEGTVRLVLSEDSVTVAPLEPAALLKLTVHVVKADGASVPA